MTVSRVLHQPNADGQAGPAPTAAAAITATAGGPGGLQAAAGAAGSATGGPARGQVVLLVVGRQYVHTIEALWADQQSALWRGDVPRDRFAPSQAEAYYGRAGLDPDVEHGGSRPVEQAPMRLGGSGGSSSSKS